MLRAFHVLSHLISFLHLDKKLLSLFCISRNWGSGRQRYLPREAADALRCGDLPQICPTHVLFHDGFPSGFAASQLIFVDLPKVLHLIPLLHRYHLLSSDFKTSTARWRGTRKYRTLEGRKIICTLTLVCHFQSQTQLMNCNAHLYDCFAFITHSKYSVNFRHCGNYTKHLQHHVTGWEVTHLGVCLKNYWISVDTQWGLDTLSALCAMLYPQAPSKYPLTEWKTFRGKK